MAYATKKYLSRPRTRGKYRGKKATGIAASVITRAVRSALMRMRFTRAARKPKFGLNVNNAHLSFGGPPRKFNIGAYSRYNFKKKEQLD